MRWPFRRSVREKVQQIEERIEQKEEAQRVAHDEVDRVNQRLKYLEAQAELLARRHITRFNH